MHELSIAMSLLDVITEELIRHRAVRPRAVTIEVGDRCGVVPEALATAFAAAVRQTEFADTVLNIRRVTGDALDVVSIEVDDGTPDPAS